ncbi:MAG TPA: NAD(P)-dependent oxidoreductase [Dehalococcoidia bacterium]|nr:NAD(P)-dependent oxidoreductase [Dehalococcoidia bacterium]
MRALILAPFADGELARLRRSVDVTYESWLESGRIHDPEELGARVRAEGASALVVEADFVFEETFEAAPDLRLVGVCRNALNHVDIDAATARGVLVTHARGRNTEAVAELTVGLMFALARRIPAASAYVAGGGWTDPAAGYRELRGREIAGSTVGVVGFGQIGRAVARRVTALGARVIAHDPLVHARTMRAADVARAALHELAAASDFVTVHVPANESTLRLVDRAFLQRMRPGAYLINTSAGAVVETAALIEALREGRIAGAALDVFEGQPLPLSSPLLAAPNVILTPHIGGATAETVARQSKMMREEIERLLAGKPLRYAVNPEATRGR